MSKMTYIEVRNALAHASNHCLQVTGSYGTITGTFESILADIVADLPKHKQQEIVRALATTCSYIDLTYTKTV